jgi:tRNA G10  N-methylase Trm11
VSRQRFADLIGRQLDLFEREQRALIAECEQAERAYDAADRDEAEERYSEYLDLVETGTELLADLRDTFAASMDEDVAEDYEEEFNSMVGGRLPRFALEIGDV